MISSSSPFFRRWFPSKFLVVVVPVVVVTSIRPRDGRCY
ncbi:hypothetical protein AALP_AA6G087500 [Arabis alpina]|uniref:Uncharacterized protein n=1 Tax=Arabis alpina TaxID=50452 RepID=A0A087GMZ4_ARAAL|nr:hypothetical protein AALP_AA6G087500 [Arabis alpina]